MQGYNYRNNSSYKRVKPRPWPWAVAPTNSRASPHPVLYCTVTISTVVLGSVQTSTPYPPPLLNTDWAPPKATLLEQGEIPLLFLLPAGIVYFIFPHISLRLRQSSRAARARP